MIRPVDLVHAAVLIAFALVMWRLAVWRLETPADRLIRDRFHATRRLPPPAPME